MYGHAVYIYIYIYMSGARTVLFCFCIRNIYFHDFLVYRVTRVNTMLIESYYVVVLLLLFCFSYYTLAHGGRLFPARTTVLARFFDRFFVGAFQTFVRLIESWVWTPVSTRQWRYTTLRAFRVAMRMARFIWSLEKQYRSVTTCPAHAEHNYCNQWIYLETR